MISKNVLRFVLSLKIRRLRQRKGFSLKELAEKSGLSHSYLNEIEKGKKYPKVEKLIGLAGALDVSVEDLVSIKMGHQLHPLLEFLESDLAANLPLSAFGIGDQDVYDLMSHAPEKFTSFLMTVSELSKSFDVSVDDLNKAALRAHLEVNQNYFPVLEDLAFATGNKLYREFKGREEDFSDYIESRLKSDFGILVKNHSLLGNGSGIGLRSVFKEGKESVLFIHSGLDTRQKLFGLLKEYCAQVLLDGHDRKKRDPLRGQFSDLLFDYQAFYLASAILINKESLRKDLEHIFSFAEFSKNSLLDCLEKYFVPPEVFMSRLTQIIPHYFEMSQLFYLRCNEEILDAPNRYFITQELHLGKLHHPHGISLREHYCRRWITTDLLKELKAGKREGPTLGVQVSKMGDKGEDYFCLSIARPRATDPNVNSCFTLGLSMDKNFSERVNFSDDVKLDRRVVGRTCERCSITDCEERVSPPNLFNQEAFKARKKELIKNILSQ